MPQADFAYAPANDLAGLPLAASIFADQMHVREGLRADVEAAGLSVHDCAALAEVFEGAPRALGQVVLLDCPLVDAAAMAALARLDMRAARSGAQLVIATGLAALDAVFACCDQSAPQILVEPTHAERVVALGRAIVRASGSRVRDLSHDDRLTLLRLTEQVDELVERLGQFAGPGSGAAPAFHFASPHRDFAGAGRHGQLVRPPRPALPDPRLVRRIIRQRQLRARFFDPALFADPAWDILLDLTAARAEHKRVSVTSLCIASGVPPTTALRWIGQLTAAGMLDRVDDEADRRRAFIALSDGTADAMARYFAAIAPTAALAL
ncbi:MAG TPA: MarR family transcriptional regulator [Croceibacterium sp.]|nr:MarR family transcriptional regulator [Croceibacterium sp.]